MLAFTNTTCTGKPDGLAAPHELLARSTIYHPISSSAGPGWCPRRCDRNRLSGTNGLLLPTRVKPKQLDSILDWAFAPAFLVAVFTSLTILGSVLQGGASAKITLGPYSYSGPLYLCPPILAMAAFSISACVYHIFVAYTQGRTLSENLERKLHAGEESMQSTGSASSGGIETQSKPKKPWETDA